MITRIHQSKVLTKPITFNCKCKLNGKTFNSNKKWNKDLFRCEYKYSNKTSCIQKRLCLEF